MRQAGAARGPSSSAGAFTPAARCSGGGKRRQKTFTAKHACMSRFLSENQHVTRESAACAPTTLRAPRAPA